MASPSSSPCSPRAAARLLLKGVQRRDPDALRRCRIQFGDLAGLTDHDVVTKMGLMRCKLVIERETHAIRTDDLAPAVTDGHVGYPLARNRTPLPTICTWKSSGTLAHIDLWQGGNPNFLVAGIPGCGKTMFVHYLAQQLLQDEGQLFVIDPGQSFASITTLQGERGRQLSIRDAGVLFNPCDGSPTFLAECIEHLVTPPGERVLNANDRKIMESAIKRAFASALYSDAKSKTSTAKPHVVLSDIAHELTDGGPDGHRMALLLQPFCAGGTYGDYLDGPSAYDWSHATVWDFECDQLRHTDKHAYAAVMACLLHGINQYAHSDRARQRHKMLVIEEGWRAMVFPFIAKQLVAISETSASAHLALGMVVQEVQDVTPTLSKPSDGQQTILMHAAHRFIFRQSPTRGREIAVLLQMREAQCEQFHMLNSLDIRRRTVLYQHMPENISGLVEFKMDQSLYWIATQNPTERQFREKRERALIASGSSPALALERAIELCITTYPDGMDHR